MTISEVIAALHCAIREFVEGAWPGFVVTKIVNESTTNAHRSPISGEFLMYENCPIFQVEAQHHGGIEKRATIWVDECSGHLAIVRETMYSSVYAKL